MVGSLTNSTFHGSSTVTADALHCPRSQITFAPIRSSSPVETVALNIWEQPSLILCQTPPSSIFVWRETVNSKMALERFELFRILQAHDVVGGDRFFNWYGRRLVRL